MLAFTIRAIVVARASLVSTNAGAFLRAYNFVLCRSLDSLLCTNMCQ